MSINAPRYATPTLRLSGRGGRVLTVYLNELRTRAGWVTWAIVAVTYLAVGLIVILNAEFASLLSGVNLALFHGPYGSPIWPYFTLIVATAVGSGCIADDLASRAITLYLSRPIHLVDYVTAKILAVASWIGISAIGPGLVGVTIAAGLGLVPLPVSLAALGAFLAVGLLTTTFFTALSVTLSTYTKKALYAGVSIFGIILSTNLATSAIASATGNSAIEYLSPVTDILAAADAAFETGAVTPVVPGTAAVLLVATAAILVVATWIRLTRFEVVGE